MNAVVSDFPWGSYNRILDIGGAYGSVLAALMESNPAAEGVLFDLPDVISRARQVQGDNLYSNLNHIGKRGILTTSSYIHLPHDCISINWFIVLRGIAE